MITGSEVTGCRAARAAGTAGTARTAGTAHLDGVGLLLRSERRIKTRACAGERERSDGGSGVANLKSRSASEQRNVLSLSSVSLYDHIRDDKAPALAAKLIQPRFPFRLRHVFEKKK